MDAIDRSNINHARWIIEWMLPDPTIRRTCLSALSESIERAHIRRSDSWGITLFPTLVRLNIGKPEAFTFVQERIYLVLDCTNCPDHIWSIPDVEQYVYEKTTPNQLFRSVPDAIGCTFPASLMHMIYPQVKSSHFSLIDKSAKTPRNPMTKQGHSPGLLDYLRSELNKTIPNPTYPQSGTYIYVLPSDDGLSEIRKELADRDWSIYNND
jgi:hypothetical protein